MELKDKQILVQEILDIYVVFHELFGSYMYQNLL